MAIRKVCVAMSGGVDSAGAALRCASRDMRYSASLCACAAPVRRIPRSRTSPTPAAWLILWASPHGFGSAGAVSAGGHGPFRQ